MNKDRFGVLQFDWDDNAVFREATDVKSVILRSTTPGSQKRFRLTVDDSGALSLQEIIPPAKEYLLRSSDLFFYSC